jgi:hypothetical protein
MPIIRNLKKDFDEGRMDSLRSISYKETGTEAPYVSKPIGSTSNQVTKRIDDLARMGKMLIDKPGLEHLAKEALLKQGEITDKLRRNSKYNTGTDVGNFLRRATGTVEHLALVAGSTLAQIPVNGTGTHFVRGYKRDTYLQESTGFKTPVAGSTYSLEGESVPMSEVNSNSILPTNNTTATPGDLGSLNIGTEGKLEGLGRTYNKYGEFTTFTGEDTLTNANNVQYGVSIPKPSDLLRNTTPASGSLGQTNKNVTGDIPEQVTLSNYRSDTTYTETETTNNANAVRTGNPVNNPKGEGIFNQTFSKQTTAAKEQFGITNAGVEGDTASSLNPDINKFKLDKTKTKLDTQGNILAAQPLITGSIVNIPLSESPLPDEYVDSQMSKELYSSGSTYTGEKAKDHISILKHGDGITAGLVNRVNLNDDTIAGSSQPIPGRLDRESATYNQTISSTKVEDFRGKDVFGGGIKNTYSFDYNDKTINKEKRVGLGNPGKRSRLRTSYTVDDPDTVDQINKLDVKKEPLDGIQENRDLVQLEFQVITPEETYYLAFRAFLDTFDDSFNASWNSSKYLGRADSFYTYNGFERSINIGFKIAAQSREEMKPLYKKAATLASVTAPSYGTGGRFMRGTIAKVTVGDYIYEQPGIIESVQYTWQKDYPWEISFQNPEGEGGKDQILPHVLDVSISFKVIHDFLPEAGVTPFITNHRPIKGNKDTYIPLEDRKFIVPETAAEKREKLAKEEAAKKEAAAQAKAASEDKILVDNNLVGPLENPNSSRETTTSPFDFGGFGI